MHLILKKKKRKKERYFISNTLKIIEEDHALLFAQSRNGFGPSYRYKRRKKTN